MNVKMSIIDSILDRLMVATLDLTGVTKAYRACLISSNPRTMHAVILTDKGLFCWVIWLDFDTAELIDDCMDKSCLKYYGFSKNTSFTYLKPAFYNHFGIRFNSEIIAEKTY